MTSRSGGHGALYLYAITRHGGRPIALPAGIGGAAVYALGDSDIAAMVSDTALPRIRPERRHLSAHHAVLQGLMQADSTLPVTFGTIATGEAAVRKMLKRHRAALVEQLALLAGQAEMGVRVNWAVPNIFEYLVARWPELKAARDHMAGRGGAATRDDKIALGSLFEQVLDEEREGLAARVEAALDACCRGLRRCTPRAESEVMNLACMVPRDRRDRFETAIAALAEQLEDSLVLSYNGPRPPYHFVHLNISL